MKIVDLVFDALLLLSCAGLMWNGLRQSRRRREYDAIVKAVLANRIEEAARLSRTYLDRYGGSGL